MLTTEITWDQLLRIFAGFWMPVPLQTEEKGLTVSQHVEGLQGASFLFGMAQQLNNWSIDAMHSNTCHCRYFPRADLESQMGGFGNFARWRFRRCHANYYALCKLFVANRKRGLESSYTIKIYLNTDNSSDSHRSLQCCPSQGWQNNNCAIILCAQFAWIFRLQIFLQIWQFFLYLLTHFLLTWHCFFLIKEWVQNHNEGLLQSQIVGSNVTFWPDKRFPLFCGFSPTLSSWNLSSCNCQAAKWCKKSQKTVRVRFWDDKVGSHFFVTLTRWRWALSPLT